ncbi:MAG TPA: FAD-dependent oxidoreductase [Gemmatimonadales bacterium]|nr:FAD-dependent oxidoreductase [Gemmatimonadales bacterium]
MTGAVAVIGAGVVGASVAYHLARRGRRDVVLLDRADGPGKGSTGRATGGYRAQYASPINVRLSLLAREKLRCFESETGVDPGYRPAGYLWLAGSQAELAVLRAGQPVQHAEGLTEAVEVSVHDVARLNPALALDEIVGGVYCPSDGFLRPLALLAGYLGAAERLGARIHWGVEATGFTRRRDGTLAAVRTTGGDLEVSAVVNCAGPWAAAVAAWAGVDLPVAAVRRQVAVTAPFDRLPADMPMTIFAGDGFHFRVRDGRVLLLWPTAGVTGRPFDDSVEDAWVDAVVAKAHRRIPVLRDAAIDRAACWGGLYEVTPDKHAILGPAPGCPNLFLANGSSGHGVMHAPALGQLLAEILCDGAATTLDVAPLRATRFAEGRPNPTSELL